MISLVHTHPVSEGFLDIFLHMREREYAEDLIPIKVEIFPVFILPLEVLEKP